MPQVSLPTASHAATSLVTASHAATSLVSAYAASPRIDLASEVPIIYDSAVFPTTEALAFVQPAGLGSPKASKANPSGAGNAEGNWWTPSSALDTDCEGNRVTSGMKLSQECVYEKKVAEIRQRQALQEQNAQFKVDKLREAEQRALDVKAKKAARDAEIRAAQAKYASRR